MTTNYNEMSNLLINKHVANILDLKESPVSGMTYGDGLIVYPHSNEVNFDPCNNPLDAWPIIVGNKINIEWRDSLKLNPLAKGTGGNACHWSDKNPLRAAMICFLRMKEIENGN
ncbi:DUF2591 domain-containing protein [Vibrio toranzoniae]|uniref:phage protein NinX family protein n=1 Tax=Vibrio toranzoniae TaxID=1194427 RepID=UPI0013769433|nr:phage protein NinX family protein [Vibrio toranzoniae]NAZ55479.1 DUF2591 domain-containing protein [Vibrio toranzoniae]